MRMMTFAKRNFKEIVRDPLNLAFLFGFPVVLLLLFTVFAAMMKTALSMVMGKPLVKCERLPGRLALVPGALLAAIILLGVAGMYFVAG